MRLIFFKIFLENFYLVFLKLWGWNRGFRSFPSSQQTGHSLIMSILVVIPGNPVNFLVLSLFCLLCLLGWFVTSTSFLCVLVLGFFLISFWKWGMGIPYFWEVVTLESCSRHPGSFFVFRVFEILTRFLWGFLVENFLLLHVVEVDCVFALISATSIREFLFLLWPLVS